MNDGESPREITWQPVTAECNATDEIVPFSFIFLDRQYREGSKCLGIYIISKEDVNSHIRSEKLEGKLSRSPEL